MRPDGSFRPAPLPPRLPLSFKLAIGGVLVAAVAVSLAVAAAAIWVISLLLPVIIIAVGVAWGAMKWRQWMSLRSDRHGGRHETGTFRN